MMFFWLVFVFVFLLPPVGYGWGYRKWGPPYPRYLQRRRGDRANRANDGGGSAPPFDHHAWGWGGDYVWAVVFIGICWLFVVSLWH